MAASNDSVADGTKSTDAEQQAAADEPGGSRRKFLARATLAMGGLLGVATAVPLVGYLFYPVGRKIVRSSDEPIDVIAANELPDDGTPKLVAVNADSVRDAWSVSAAPLGAVWLRRVEGKVEALSSTCPHLGCAIGYDPGSKQYKCPCHRSAFGLDGEKLSGPSKRGMDPLVAKVGADGRIRVTFKKYRPDVSGREEV